MTSSITYIDRKTGKTCTENVWGEGALQFLYGSDLVSQVLGVPLLHCLVKRPFFSKLYGLWQSSSYSRHKVQPFINQFQMDSSEFAKQEFSSFNDFFTRKLKPETRPIEKDADAIIPADARYLFFPKLDKEEWFEVKGRRFSMRSLLQNEELANSYCGGSVAIARLCPTDYHRFHFPCACLPEKSTLINGPLYSVNPIALASSLSVLTENKRVVTLLQQTPFGPVAYVEVGATCVGSVEQTYTPGTPYVKGEEKGYFSFGGSTLILLFRKGSIAFDEDLAAASEQKLEILCSMGQSMGHAL